MIFVVGTTRVEITPHGTKITLPSGSEVHGVPQDTNEYRATAQRLGYGTDTLAMCKDHDLLHVLLCDWLGVSSSYSLRHAARCGGCEALAEAEEEAVLAVQRFMRLANKTLPLPSGWV